MKVSTVAVVACCCLSAGYGIYLKTYDTFARVTQAREGMTRQQVLAVLHAPDSTYWEQSKEKSTKDSLLVMAYTIKGSDEDKTILVKLRHDTVRSVIMPLIK